MHLLIPFAAPLSDGGRAAAATLQLPHLRALLARCREVQRDTGDEWTLSPPHERVLARALGWHGASGNLPFAARAARADGIDTAGLAWGLLTPVHWHMGADHVRLLDPAALMLDDAGSSAMFTAVRDLFTSEGFALHAGAPLRWYAAHASLADLPTASLDRVIGRNVDAWLGDAGAHPALRLLRRLQNEVQMLLYTHPLHDQRVAAGLLPVNSFWLSGCGASQPETGAAPVIDERLRAPALADDWAGWAKAWETLDAGPLADAAARVPRGEPLCLTLCGERSAASFEPVPRTWADKLTPWRSAPPVLPLLESL